MKKIPNCYEARGVLFKEEQEALEFEERENLKDRLEHLLKENLEDWDPETGWCFVLLDVLADFVLEERDPPEKPQNCCVKEFEELKAQGVLGMSNKELDCTCSLSDISKIKCPGYVPAVECVQQKALDLEKTDNFVKLPSPPMPAPYPVARFEVLAPHAKLALEKLTSEYKVKAKGNFPYCNDFDVVHLILMADGGIFASLFPPAGFVEKLEEKGFEERIKELFGERKDEQ